jgi:PadR family transcriptional regulator PadR
MFYIVKLMTSRPIGEFELAVLLCVNSVGDDAYGASIRRAVSQRLNRDCSVGAVYTTLQRLEDKGLVKSWTSDPTPVRGGRSRRCFAVTGAGNQAIRSAQTTLRRLWRDHGLRWSGGV